MMKQFVDAFAMLSLIANTSINYRVSYATCMKQISYAIIPKEDLTYYYIAMDIAVACICLALIILIIYSCVIKKRESKNG